MAAKSKKKNTKKKKPVSQSRLEIWGVICIAIGLFLGVSLYSEAVGVVGVAVSKFIFGMFGLFSYAIPVAFVAGGILLIVNAKDNFHKSSIVLAVIGLWLIVGVIHIATRPSISNVDFLKYGNDAYLLGQTLHKGGGIFGGGKNPNPDTDTADTIVVPNLVGKHIDEISADAELMANFIFDAQNQKEEFSDKPVGTVLKQSLQDGIRVKKGTKTIVLTISKGQDMVQLPDVVGGDWHRRDAQAQLEQLGFKVY